MPGLRGQVQGEDFIGIEPGGDRDRRTLRQVHRERRTDTRARPNQGWRRTRARLFELNFSQAAGFSFHPTQPASPSPHRLDGWAGRILSTPMPLACNCSVNSARDHT